MSLPRLLERAARPTLLLVDPALARRLRTSTSPDGVSMHVFGEPVDPATADARWACVVRRRARPRRAAPGRRDGAAGRPDPRGGRLARRRRRRRSCPTYARSGPTWWSSTPTSPPSGGAVTPAALPLGRRPSTRCSARLGVDAGSRGTAARGGLVVGGDAGPADAQVPPDVVRGGAAERAPHPVTGRRAVLLAERRGRCVVDEGVFNPAGFRRDWSRGRGGPAVRAGDGRHRGPAAGRPGRAGAAGRRRRTTSPRWRWRACRSSVRRRRRAGPDRWRALLAAGVDLEDRLRREEHSVRLRRAAAAGHSTLAGRHATRRRGPGCGPWGCRR